MKHSRVMNAIILVILLLSSAPVKGQDTAGSQQYLPFLVRGQSSTSAHGHTPPEQRTQTTGVTFTVTKFTDSADGVCDADCSLREAVSVANQTPGADTIVLNGGTYQLTIPPTLDDQNLPIDDENNAISDLDVADNLTIVGVSAETTKIASAMHARVIKVLAGATVRLSQLTITGGSTTLFGGGLFNAGNLTLQNVHIAANEAIINFADGFSAGDGGGLYNVGTLALFDTAIVDNAAVDTAGGLFNTGEMTLENVQVTRNHISGFDSRGRGGGIYNTGSLTIHTSQITDNSARVHGSGVGSGGGIDNDESGVLQLYDSLLQNNLTSSAEADSFGGGITNRGHAVIYRSAIADNSTDGGSGGLANFGGILRVVNSTVSGNRGHWLYSVGGIVNAAGWNGTSEGKLTLLNVTVSGNTGGGLHNQGTMQVGNTLIVGSLMDGNDTLTCVNEGNFTSLGHNILDSQGACPHTGKADQVVDHATVFSKLLGPLRNNDSALPTHALLRGSVAIDAGDDDLCASAEVGGVDQRGVARPQGAHCDVGAHEGVAENIFSPTKFTDSFDGVCDADCSLREAINAANQHPGADIVPLVAGIYQLTIPPKPSNFGPPQDDENNAISDLDITDDLTLVGAGAEMTTIESAMQARVLKVLAGATVRLSQLTITGGSTTLQGGGIFNAGELTLTNVHIEANEASFYYNEYWWNGSGGGIYNVGKLALSDTTVINNEAIVSGGGIFNAGELTLTNVQVAGNSNDVFELAAYGGGIYNKGNLTIHTSQIINNNTHTDLSCASGGGIDNDGVLQVYDSLIQANGAWGNECASTGGGITSRNEALISNTTIVSNTASAVGGGIASLGGKVNVVNSLIKLNQSQIGGGLSNNGAGLTLLNSTVSQNIASGDGGGIYSDGAGSLVTLQNSTVSENQSTNGGSGGGLWNSGGSTMTLLNTTISGNRSSYNGGGINNTRNAGLFTILNSTIANNHAEGNGGGIWNDENSTLTYRNTIIAGNSAAQSGPDCQNEAILTSQGHNLVGNSTGCDSSAPGDLTVDPTTIFLHILQSLRVNAPGQTATHALAAGSPAVDAGDDAVCPATDQREVARPQGSHCDIGAYEGAQQGVVSWWQAEGNANDAIGGNHGVLQNQASFAPGFSGQAFTLDGVDDWVMIPSSPSLNLGTRDFTMALWVNFASTDGEQVLLEKFVETLRDQDRPRIGWSITKLDEQAIRVVGSLLTDDGAILNSGGLPIPNNRWLYVAFTRQGNNFTLYWDGQPIGSAWMDVNLDSEATLKMGHRGNPTDTPGSMDDRGFYLHGCMDEVQLWDHALSGDEIAATAALGRDEVCTAAPATPDALFVSSHSSGKAGDVKFRDEDIVAYDFTSSAWHMVFDGSNVGVTKDVDAFAFRPDGTLLLSFNAPTNVPGLGKVDDSDIVQFIPTQLGNDTAGSFALYLRGADVGLTTDGEDIDAIGFTADDHLIVSTIGDFNTPALAGKDEDLIRLDDASSGAWSMFLAGSAVGLANEDVNGVWLDPANGQLYLTVKDSFAFDTTPVDSNDIFICTPTADGSCTYGPFWDADAHAYGSKNLDGLYLGVLPPTFQAGAAVQSADAMTAEEAIPDEDSDDLDVPELSNGIFLPLIQQ